MKPHIFSRLAQAAALALMVGVVYALGASPTAWANSSKGNQGTVPPRAADLSISKSGSWSGNEIHFTLRVSNAGPVVAENVVITDNVTGQLRIQGVSITDGRCSTSGQRVTCRLRDLAAGESTRVTIRTRPKDNKVQEYRNTASVSSSTPDPNEGNNASSTTVAPRNADLSINKGGSWSGNEVRFTLRVANTGPTVARDVVITDNVPGQLRIQGVSITDGRCSTSGQQVTCRLRDLAGGQSTTITIRTRPVNGQVSQITNRASVSSSTSEANMGNNASSVTLNRR